MKLWNKLLNGLSRPLSDNLRKEKIPLILMGALGLTSLLLSLEFHLFEANLFDFRSTLGFQPKADPQIVTVAIDDESVKAFDEFSPFPLDYHTRLLEWMESVKPKAVGYLVDLNRVYQAAPELFQNSWAQRFVDSVQRMERNGIPVVLGTTYDVTGEVVPPYPLSLLPHSIAVIHKDGNLFGEDRITRRALVRLYDQPSFHVEFSRKLGLLSADEKPSGSYDVKELQSEYFFFRYHGSTQIKNSPYPNYSFHDILSGKLNPSDFRDKIILIGTVQRDDSTDYALTPYSKEAFSNPKLLIHANILDSVMNKQSIQRVPWQVNWIITFFSVLAVMLLVLFSTPGYSLIATIGLAGIFLGIGHFLFQGYGIWVRESQPLIGIFLAYYLFVPYRLIREYRKRWDYQRKNELLIQVEELKTHFMSLVTHDLKTPVAKIQGLTETLVRILGSKIQDVEKKALAGILTATNDLNRFITSILELNKVESNRLQISFQSKDINAIIEGAAAQFSDQAEAKRIQLKLELEPLFSISVDPILMSKVFTNLIDNAIKYSPENSSITIRSGEEGDQVVISFSDEGIGLSTEELEQLFTRFYRAKNDTTAGTTGTGLGLYLARYFIEAHRGRIEVSSVQGKGTTFKIFLPIHSKGHLPTGLTSDIGQSRTSEISKAIKENPHA